MTFQELLDYLEINKGDLIYVHSSFSRLKMFGLSATEIIKELINRVDKEGTIVFPSFCWNIEPSERPWKGYEKYFSSKILFDVRNTISNIGYLPEQFRKYDGVLRSAHPFWSVCAIGPLAKTLVEKQEFVVNPYGHQSSFAIMRDNNVKIVGLGVTLNTTSLCPVVDFDLGQNHTQKVFTDHPITTNVINQEGNLLMCKTYTMLPEAVRYIKPSKVFEKSERIREKTLFIEINCSYFFSYYFMDFYKEAIRFGKEAIKLGKKMPWLELLPLKDRIKIREDAQRL